MTDEYDIVIDERGDIAFVYSDLLAEVFDGEPQETRRVSMVEPAWTVGWECDGWVADMKPSGGPLLYASKGDRGVKQPFKTRQAALEAERRWLREHKGL